MQNFKQKKDIFDQQVQRLQIDADQSDKFFTTLSNLQIIEKRKVEELSSLIASLEYMYIRKNTFKDSIDQLKLALAKDVQQSKAKIEFYNQLKQQNKVVSKKNNKTLKFKHEIYKYMDREYHYLKKQQELEGKRKIEIERDLTPNKTVKTKDALIRTEQKLQNALEKTDQSLIDFYSKYKEAENHKYTVMDPVVTSLANFNKNYFDQMNKNYQRVNFGYTNPYTSNMNNSEVIDNFRINQQNQREFKSSDLQQELLQSNHSNRQQDDMRESNLNQTIYMKNEENSPKSTSFQTKNRNVIQQYDPPTIYKQSNYNQGMPMELDYNKPDQSGNHIPYMLNNAQEISPPINDLVTPFMQSKMNEDKMKSLWNSDRFNQVQNQSPSNNNYQQQYNYQNPTQSFGQFQNNISGNQFQGQNNFQRQEQFESQKQSQYGSNYYPFQNVNQESHYDQQENDPSVFSFREYKVHPQRFTQAVSTNDNFFNS